MFTRSLSSRLAALSLATLAFTAPVYAGETFTIPGPIDVDGLADTAPNVIQTYSAASSYVMGNTLNFTGTLTEVNTATFANEARIRVRNSGLSGFFDVQPFTTGNFTGSVAANNVSLPTGSFAGQSIVAGSTWTFTYFDSFADAGIDARWTNIGMTFNDFVPAPPPAATDLGVLSGDSSFTTGAFTAGQTKWFKFTLRGLSDGTGNYLDLFTDAISGVTLDTEIALYRAGGALVTTSDDEGAGLFSALSLGDTTPVRTYTPSTGSGTGMVTFSGQNGALAAGEYYLAANLFNATYSGDFGVTSTSLANATGFQVNLRSNIVAVTVPEAGSFGLVGAGLLTLSGVVLQRRRKA